MNEAEKDERYWLAAIEDDLQMLIRLNKLSALHSMMEHASWDGRAVIRTAIGEMLARTLPVVYRDVEAAEAAERAEEKERSEHWRKVNEEAAQRKADKVVRRSWLKKLFRYP